MTISFSGFDVFLLSIVIGCGFVVGIICALFIIGMFNAALRFILSLGQQLSQQK